MTRLVAERAPPGKVGTYPSTHFDFYDDPTRGTVVADQIEFLKNTLCAT